MGLTDDLERLAALHREGALSDGEYRAAKASLLSGPQPASIEATEEPIGSAHKSGSALEAVQAGAVGPPPSSAAGAGRRGSWVVAAAVLLLVALVIAGVVAVNGDDASCRSTAIDWADRGRRAGARGIEAVGQEMRLELERDDWRRASEVALSFVRNTISLGGEGAITRRDIEQFVDNSGVVCASE